MPASRALRQRVLSDARRPDYWYVPKGKALAPSNWEKIAGHLAVLKRYARVPWDDAQPRYARELARRGLIDPYRRRHTEGFSAVARMQLPVWALLGLAWINPKGEPELTEVGRRFARARTMRQRRELITTQLHRYQFHNPSMARHFNAFHSFPVLALYHVLAQVAHRMSWEEFALWGTRIRSFRDAGEVAQLIIEWRDLGPADRREILTLVRTVPAESHRKTEEGTTWGTVQRDLPYIRAFLRGLGTVEETADGLVVPQSMRGKVVRLGADAAQGAEFIDYASEQDWLAYYGQTPTRRDGAAPWTTASDARSYYERIGQIDAAVAALQRERPQVTGAELREYRSVRAKERVLEDLLEDNVEVLESGLTIIGRQYPTKVGPIDLLAKGPGNIYVVIELKRDRASDEVVGQILRYMTWVIDRLAGGDASRVRGIIVGRRYDAKFEAALARLSRVAAFTFDIRLACTRWAGDRGGLKARTPRKQRAVAHA